MKFEGFLSETTIHIGVLKINCTSSVISPFSVCIKYLLIVEMSMYPVFKILKIPNNSAT